MSITATANYMSNAYIEQWMDQKTDGLYGGMREAMDTTDHRAAAEAELNKIKAMLVAAKGQDGNAVRDEINTALQDYKDVPGVADTLQPIADKLQSQYELAEDANYTPATARGGDVISASTGSQSSNPSFNINSEDATSWGDAIDNAVSDLGKKDQLGLINIQELNNQINQAKQIASALIDSADKSASAIISHIA
jgi:hypothetical protein